ncbi:chromosome partition protein Smc [Tepiditoga spiralis]|uniref:Chromosome partition protein Smc n=1 Tax=Tepiditoga spiralis TaxID=2108365 RepID=A0A7G1G434_9BACT|nr:chromosome segregation protein SMC [Tepiditoga spiralis]BBE31101.1 chromosome partition protein Smc [Tepiditoga spiralis]
MELLNLTIDGFKSFAKPTSFELNKKIIAIVGPNGSGKSNIVDAIRWLLGEQSSKQMRIDDRTDVIFSGTEKLKPAKIAKVFLTLKNEKNEIFEIGKILDKNSGKYLLNNKTSTLKELHSIFSNGGVGKQFYSIISQGQVSDIVKSSPEDLRDLVLGIIDIGKYLKEKETSLKLLEKTSENLERLKDVLFETEKRLKNLSNRASRAKKHLSYTNELKNIGKKFYGAKKISIKLKIDSLKYLNEELSKEMKELLSKSFDAERAYMSLKQEIENVDKSLSQNGEIIENYRNRISLLEKEKNRISELLNNTNSKIVEHDWKIKTYTENLKKLELRYTEIKDLSEKYYNDMIKVKNKLEIITSEKNELDEKVSEQNKKISEFKAKLSQEKNLFTETNKKLSTSNKEITGKQERISYLNEEFKKLEKDIKNLSKEIQKIEDKLKISTDEEKTLKEIIIKEKNKQSIEFQELEKIKNELNYFFKEKQESEYKLEIIKNQVNSYDGYSKSIKEFFKRFKDEKNVIDVVANLIEVEEQFEEAISAAAGAKLQNIVINSSSEADKYINYMKRVGGRITFLPLDLMKGTYALNKNILKEAGVIDYLINIVEFDKKYIKVMQYTFSNILLVDELKTAITISKNGFKSTIVTLKGEVVYGSGAISGGKTRYDSSIILKRKREIEELKLKIEESIENINYYKDLEEQKSQKIKKLKLHLNSLEEELKELILKRNIESSNYKQLNNDLKNKKSSYDSILNRIETYKNELNELNKEINSLKVIQKEQEKNIKYYTEELSIFSENSTQYTEKMNKINFEILEKNSQLKNTEEKYYMYLNEKKSINHEINNLKNNIINNETEFKNLKSLLETYKKDFEKVQNSHKTLSEEISKIFDIMKNNRKGKVEKIDKLEELDKNRTNIKNKIQEIKDKKNKNDFDIKTLEQNIKFIVEKAKNIDLNEEEFEKEQLEEFEIKALENRIKDIEKALKNIGSVDLTVLKEYKEVRNDFEQKNIEKKDILDSIKKIKDSIDLLDETAEKEFFNFFNLLNEEFKKLVSKLFVNGYGELNLIGEGKDFEKGIQISVKKAGRRFQKLSLFSGGEKALIAIAFLFAMMNLNPSPFYILDEIDAPLDDINAGKIASLIHENSNKSQFLVITHNKLMMEIAEVFYGITMKQGITKVVPVNFKLLEKGVNS